MRPARNVATAASARAWAGLVILALAGCQSEKKTPEQSTAAGEILPGSASDAMLPYDTVRSQPPLAPEPDATGKPETKGGKGKEAAAKGSDAADEATPAASGAPAPAASAAPQ